MIPIDIQRSRRLHSRPSMPPAKNRQLPGARLTEKSQRHGELLNGSLMLPVGCTNRPSPFGASPLRLPPSVSFACPSSFVFFPSLLFFFLTPHLSFALTICTHVYVCGKSFEATELLFPAWSNRLGSSRIKLDNKPRSQRDENRGRQGAKEREDKYRREKERESRKQMSIGEQDKYRDNGHDFDGETLKGWSARIPNMEENS